MTRPYGKHHLTDAQRKLAEENLPLVWWFIGNRLSSRGLITVSETDDVASYLMFYLCRAAENFDADKNVKFSTYAIYAFWRAFNLYRTDRDKYQKHTRLSAFVVDCDEKEIADTLADESYKDEPEVCWRDVSPLFDHISLSDNEAVMVDMYYRERKGPSEMAQLLHKTPSNILAVLRNIKHKLAVYVKHAGLTVERFTERRIA